MTPVEIDAAIEAEIERLKISEVHFENGIPKFSDRALTIEEKEIYRQRLKEIYEQK